MARDWYKTLGAKHGGGTPSPVLENALVLNNIDEDWSDELIFHLSLDETSGNRADAHDNALTFTDVNTVGAAAAKVGANAAAFVRAASERLTRANGVLIQTGAIDFTFAVWVKFRAVTGTQVICGKFNAAAGGEWALLHAAGTGWVFRVYDSGGFTSAVVNTSVVAETWYCVIGRHRAAEKVVDLSIDGAAFAGEADYTGTLGTNTATMEVGGGGSGTAEYHNGDLDEPRFDKRAWQAKDVAAYYNGGAGAAYVAGGDYVNNNLVSDLLAAAGAEDAVGIAITAVPDIGEGIWQYKLVSGGWNAFPADVNDDAAVVLPATARLRFFPESDFYGATTGPMECRAWNGDGVYADAPAQHDIEPHIGTRFSDPPVEVQVTVDPIYVPSDIQVFSADGTWTKPEGAVFLLVILQAGGGGGGSGRKGAVGTFRGGGGGGSGGEYGSYYVPASAYGSTEAVVIGAGGSGGSVQTTDSTNGSLGSVGSNTTFGAAGETQLRSVGGAAGLAGVAGSSGSALGNTSNWDAAINQSTNAGASGSRTGTASTASSHRTATGGGGGGGVSSGNVVGAGGSGGNRTTGSGWDQNLTSAGGATEGVDGGDGVSQAPADAYCGGNGGGGGAGGSSVKPGDGGDGIDGGGGGGGGGGTNGTVSSGAGGRGGDGFAVVITFR